MNLETIIGALNLGSIYAVMALGIYITYKILDFPDLTVDGSFPLGGAVTAAIINAGGNPAAAIAASAIAGTFAGFLTGVIHVKLKIRDLLSGIIMMTALYSVNFIIVGSKASLPVTGKDTVFSNSFTRNLFGEKASDNAPLHSLFDFKELITVVIFLIVLKVLLDLFMKSKRGYLLKAMGDNPTVVATLAKNGGNVKIMGLAIANAFVSVSGSLFCQYNKTFFLTDGTGKMVIGLAAVIIGINIFGKIRHIASTTAVMIGAVIYTACVTLALAKFPANIMKLVTAVLFLLVLVLGQVKIGTLNFSSKKGGDKK